jgi:DNA invertase Pin-like site-specific DNA recombinase
MKTAIAYTRVSTVQQGKSGLGLEAQQAALARFAEAERFDLIQTFQEVEPERVPMRSTDGLNWLRP